MKPSLDTLRAKVAEIEGRKPLNRAQAIAVLCRQGGGIACGCGCGEPLDPLVEGVVDEHVLALALRPDDPNGLRNREFWRKPCSLEKTKADVKAIAKAKRLAGETCTGPRRPIPQRENPWPPAGSRKLGSRPFPKRNTEGAAS
jgi:hypothetical protein